MTGFTKGRRKEDEHHDQQPHREYRYLVSWGWTQGWVHCPFCQSVNDGWAGHKPRYTGGVVYEEVPIFEGSKHTHTVAMACICEDGDPYHELQHMSRWSGNYPERLERKPPVVLWDKNEFPEKPDNIPSPPPAENCQNYSRGMAAQTNRFLSGEITAAQLEENRAALEEKYMGPKITEPIGGDDIPF